MKTLKRTLIILLAAACWLAPADTGTAQDPAAEPGPNPVPANPAQAQAEATEQEPVMAPAFPAEEGHGLNRDAVVSFGKSVVLKPNESAEAVVVIGGSAKIQGTVHQAVVVIGGDAEITGEVGQAVVAVLGGVKARKGAKIHGDVVAVGGKLDVEDGARISGQTQEVDFGSLGLPNVEWLRKWFVQCVLKMRPLAPQVGWVWGVAGVFFLLYLLIAAIFPRPVQVCVDELTRRPATTFLLGLMTKLLLPLVLLILSITGVGVFVVPFVIAAVVLGGVLGKVALLEWLGFKLGRQFGGGDFNKPLAAFLIGTAVITLLYMVPVIGLLTFGIISLWGLGGAVSAAFGGLRREIPPRSAPLIPAAAAMGSAGTAAFVAPTLPPPHNPGPDPATDAVSTPTPSSMPPSPPVAPANVPEPLIYPKAGFWERLGAGFLDTVLVIILGAIAHGPPLAFLVALAYFAGLWAWRGTSIGGIVLGLKVVRLDGQPVTFPVALVRALAAAFSIVVLFLGFLWIAWDKDRQGWHDKIAGTVVLRLPRATPLICL